MQSKVVRLQLPRFIHLLAVDGGAYATSLLHLSNLRPQPAFPRSSRVVDYLTCFISCNTSVGARRHVCFRIEARPVYAQCRSMLFTLQVWLRKPPSLLSYVLVGHC